MAWNKITIRTTRAVRMSSLMGLVVVDPSACSLFTRTGTRIVVKFDGKGARERALLPTPQISGLCSKRWTLRSYTCQPQPSQVSRRR